MRFLGAFVFGAVLCTALDHQHVVWGVLSYPHPDLWQQAWWVPLLFFFSTLGALFATDLIRRLVGAGAGPAPSFGLVVTDMASFSMAYYFTAVAHHAPDVVTAVLVGTWMVRVLSGLPGWAVAYCIAAALIGPAVEATLSALGGFHYHHPDFIGVARWLPALYLHAGVASVSLAGFLKTPEPPIEIEVVV